MAREVDSRYPTPEALFERWRDYGDADSLGDLFDRTAPTLFRIALALLPDAASAEDALQETYLAAMESAASWDATRPLLPWLVGVLQMQVRRDRRSRARVPDAARVTVPAGEPAPEPKAERAEESERVRAAIEALDEPYRSVALLRWRYGLSPAEIADVRNEPPGTTRSLLSRALAKMRTTLRFVPAVFLGTGLPRGLAAVRRAVVTGAVPAAAAGTATVATVVLVKWLVAATAVVGVGAGSLWAWRAATDGGDSAGREAPRETASAEGASAPRPDAAPLTLRPSAPRPAAESDGRGSGAGVVPAGKARDGAGTPAPSSGAAADSPAGKDLTTTAAPEAKTEGRAPVVDPFPAAVAQAIDKAKKWLLSQQQPDGSWRGPVEERRGPDQEDPGTVAAVTTGLTLYALLRAGANPEDRAVERGLAWLSAIPIGSGTREMRALRLLALVAREEARRPADPGERVEVPAEAIQGIRSLVTLGAGEWASSAGGAAQDLPVMDWSALSLVAAARLGVVVPDSTWTEILEIALARQEWKGLSSPRVLGAEGGTDRTRGFVYPLGESRVPRAADVTALRTAAGLSTVLAARYVLGAEGIQRSKTTLRPSTVQTAMFDAAAWLDVAWPGVALAQAVQSGRRSTYRYVEPATLAWAVHLEHAMAFVGVDRLGAHVWHREIGDALLQWQRDDGGWAIDTYIDQDSRTTSSALLFLVRASRPTVAAPSIAGPEKPLRAR